MADKKEKVGFFGSIKNFFKGLGKRAKEIKAEMKKIVWPTKAQVINNTLVVIVVSIIAAICIFGLDTIFGFIVDLSTKLKRGVNYVRGKMVCGSHIFRL